MFIVLRNYISNELIIYLLFSYYYYEKICNKIYLLLKIHLFTNYPRKNPKAATDCRHFITYVLLLTFLTKKGLNLLHTSFFYIILHIQKATFFYGLCKIVPKKKKLCVIKNTAKKRFG